MGEFFGILVVLALIALGIYIYFLPTIVAVKREHVNSTSIAVLNVLLGWTFIGWVVAIVWAYTAQPKQPPPVPNRAPARSALHTPKQAPIQPTPNSETLCPFCAETIKAAAIVCKHCGRDLPAKETAGAAAPPALVAKHEMEARMAAEGVLLVDGFYKHRGLNYARLEDALAAAAAASNVESDAATALQEEAVKRGIVWMNEEQRYLWRGSFFKLLSEAVTFARTHS